MSANSSTKNSSSNNFPSSQEPDLYLASRSPRRRELLELMGVNFAVRSIETDETILVAEQPEDAVRRLAEQKALVIHSENTPVLGADTIVVLGDHILGKPSDEDAAVSMLLSLSAMNHKVMTSVAVQRDGKVKSFVQTSEITMAVISEEDAQSYVATGEPMDKAGAYGIQGLGGLFIKDIKGSYSGVMGLPVYETRLLLHGFAVATKI